MNQILITGNQKIYIQMDPKNYALLVSFLSINTDAEFYTQQ